MKKALSLCLKYLSLFTVMGSIYYLIEIIWRGYSHVSMFILAGVCGICIGLINEILSMDTPIWLQAIIGSCIVTTGEFISGCILNLWLGLGIWDYSNMPFNLLGQICLPFSLLWVSGRGRCRGPQESAAWPARSSGRRCPASRRCPRPCSRGRWRCGCPG